MFQKCLKKLRVIYYNSGSSWKLHQPWSYDTISVGQLKAKRNERRSQVMPAWSRHLFLKRYFGLGKDAGVNKEASTISPSGITVKFSMIPPSSTFILKEKLQKKLLFCSGEMQGGHFIDKMIVPINMMLKTETEILNQSHRHKRFYNSDPAHSFRTFLIKYPIIVSIKRR